MKYLKMFEDVGKLYWVTTEKKYYEEEFDIISSYEYKSIESYVKNGIKSQNLNIKFHFNEYNKGLDVIFIGKKPKEDHEEYSEDTIYLDIRKNYDDYYYIIEDTEENFRLKEKGKYDPRGMYIYFACDGLDGLKEFFEYYIGIIKDDGFKIVLT
jgi:hypothetical protein